MSDRSPKPTANRGLGALLNELSLLMRREFDRRLQPLDLGLTRARWLILYHVKRKAGCTQRELAEQLQLRPMTVGRQVGKLVDIGWLERRDDPRDQRAYSLHLKPAARKIFTRLRPVVQAFRSTYFAGIPPSRRDALFADLLIIKRNLLQLERRAVPTLSSHEKSGKAF
ncbi:MAG: MarR family transcriptional regulator [Nibricoccus sp.]